MMYMYALICMYIFVYVVICVCMRICMYMCVFAYFNACYMFVYVLVYRCIDVYWVCTHAASSRCTCMGMYLYACICVNLWGLEVNLHDLFMRACMYVYT
jgi:hypothetical protein